MGPGAEHGGGGLKAAAAGGGEQEFKRAINYVTKIKNRFNDDQVRNRRFRRSLAARGGSGDLKLRFNCRAPLGIVSFLFWRIFV